MSITQGEAMAAVCQVLLAVTVLDEVDVLPTAEGIVLGLDAGANPVLAWDRAADVLAGASASSPAARVRLRSWLRQHAALAERGADALRASVRPLALAADSRLHPGRAWARADVLGGALELGLGVVRPAREAEQPDALAALDALDPLGQLDGPPELSEPLWPDVATAAGLGRSGRHALGSAVGGSTWVRALGHLEVMGDLAGRRLRRRDDGVLTAAGGCDVPTLLASNALRQHLLAVRGAGMCAVATPARARGWVDEARIEPAFVAAAWSATGLSDQGVATPLLVTADEVAPAVRLAG